MKTVFAMAFAGAVCVAASGEDAASEKGARTSVRLEDVPKRAVIVGRLGVPIAEIVDVKGRWVARTEKPDNAPWFTVTEVNGRAFDAPLLFRAHSVEPAAGSVEEVEPREGDVWEMRGIEVFDFAGMPENVRKELKLVPFAQREAGFVSRFKYVRARIVPADKPDECR
jgi:hypothetical protein